MRSVLLAALLWLALTTEAASPPATCTDDETRERLRALVLDSMDTALRSYITNLFTVWVRDEKLDTQRARMGMHNAVRAWARARKAVVNWDIPEC